MVPANGSPLRSASIPISRLRRLILILLHLVLIGCAATATVAPLPPPPAVPPPAETATEARLEAARRDPAALKDFFRRMPKGGDLHIHASGALYPQELLRIAAGRGLCVNPVSGELAKPPCGPAAAGHTLAAVHALDSREMADNLSDLWSMRGPFAPGKAGHDHFFAIFGRTRQATEEVPVILSELRQRTAKENIQYLEVMFRVRDADERALAIARKIGWSDDLVLLRDRLLAAGLGNIIQEARDGIRERHEESLRSLGCGTAEAKPGCGVTARYQPYATRTLPKEFVFVQLLLAFEAARENPLVAGVNIVGPEDDPVALADHPLHMKMVGTLHRLYPGVRIAVEAGELTPDLAPPEALGFHVGEAVTTAHAERIGHGVDIRHGTAAGDTLRKMATRRVAIEVMPTSSRFILNLDGAHHPFPDYLERGVPAVLATDDPGILLTDLSMEFAVIAVRYPHLSWRDFRNLARNSLEYSFLQGKSLWKDGGEYRRVADSCHSQKTGNPKPPANCAAFLRENPKAAFQWELEGRLAAFEAESTAAVKQK